MKAYSLAQPNDFEADYYLIGVGCAAKSDSVPPWRTKFDRVPRSKPCAQCQVESLNG
jgi:hypothetical protein